MESTMPANVTVSAVIRAGPFMSFFFSFRSCVVIAHLQNYASGSGREIPNPGWPNCTPTAVKPTVFFDRTESIVQPKSQLSTTQLIDACCMANFDHLGHLHEAERVVAKPVGHDERR
jgi:hypothetical protein